MAVWRYRDFLAVSEDFIPVFSEDVDKNHQGNWKYFIPHNEMRNLLERLAVALERAHTGDNRSLWLTGAYGTGKTFAAFVVKHLLEDPVDTIRDYFEKHQLIAPLWPRFKALRQNKQYLVVYRSTSGHITSSRRLMIEVQQAIKDQLRARGHTKTFAPTLIDQIVEKLTDESGIFNWKAAFNKYRGLFKSAQTPEEVIDGLRSGNVKLAEQVCLVLDEEGMALLDSPTEVKAWIRDIIAANGLAGIIYIWDEFTEFFENNVPVTPLQGLVEASADMPFYFLLITHRGISQFSRIDEATRNKLLDRFHVCKLEMAPVTAYKLIANAIEPCPEHCTEWEAKADSLWSKVDIAVLHIRHFGDKVNKEELKRMAPIHPFTAYLLASISSLYSSSQRTLFQFLKTEAPGSFQWFIANYPQEEWYWLTPDYLWQYFFEDTKIESVEPVADLLSHYRLSAGDLDPHELRVFRVVLLLIALWRQTHGASDLLRASLSVVKHMFVGTDLQHRIPDIANKLCDRGVLRAVPSGNDYDYIVPTAVVDRDKLEECRRRVELTLTFENVIKSDRQEGAIGDDLKKLFSLQGAAKLRHPVEIVSARDLKLRREHVFRGPQKPFEIGVVFVVTQQEDHLIGTEQIAAAMTNSHTNYCVLISQSPFGNRAWTEWLSHQAYSLYYQQVNDIGNQRFYNVKASNTVAQWLSSLRTGQVRVFFKGKQKELSGCEVVAEYLSDIAAAVFPYGPERISRINTLYDHTYGRAGAEIGLKVAENIQQPYKSVVDALREVWDKDMMSPEHPVGRMQALVDRFFAQQDHVNLRQLWDALQQPPFGLMPSPIGILLFGFVMRKYSQGYYYSDGVVSLPLNPNKMAELIEQVVKGFRQSDSYTIRRMSTHGEQFCQMARDIFHLTQEQANYPDAAQKGMRDALLRLGYPLWAAVHALYDAPNASSADEVKPAVQALEEALSYEQSELSDRDMQAVVEAVKPVRRDLASMMTRDRLQKGMMRFFKHSSPCLASLMAKLNMGIPQMMSRLRELLQEDVYLWRESRVSEKIPDVVQEMDLVDALNTLCDTNKCSLDDLRSHFRSTWFRSKFPLWCYEVGEALELVDSIDYLHGLVYQSLGPDENRTNQIRQHANELKTVLSDHLTVTKTLAAKYAQQEIDESDAADLYAALPELSGAGEREVKQAIIQALSQLSRRKKVVDLKRRWQELTGAKSPADWSEENGVPIEWVLQGRLDHGFYGYFERAEQLSEKELDEALAYLDQHEDVFSVLQDSEYVLERFIDVAAGVYADLVRQSGTARQLWGYVRRAMNARVHEWRVRLNEVQSVVAKWVTDNYKVSAYPRVLEAIESISTSEIKQFIKQLAASDPIVGARLMASIWKSQAGPSRG